MSNEDFIEVDGIRVTKEVARDWRGLISELDFERQALKSRVEELERKLQNAQEEPSYQDACNEIDEGFLELCYALSINPEFYDEDVATAACLSNALSDIAKKLEPFEFTPNDDDGTLIPNAAPSVEAGAVPEGWKLVPIEPTKHMRYAVEDTQLPEFCTSSRQSRHHNLGAHVYRAMINAAPTPPASAKPIAWVRMVDGKIACSEDCLGEREGDLECDSEAGEYEVPLYTTPPASAEPFRPTDDELWDQTVTERDNYHDMADRLANAIAEFFNLDIGEHSSANCPWMNALDQMPDRAASAGGLNKAAIHQVAFELGGDEAGVGYMIMTEELDELLNRIERGEFNRQGGPSER